MDINAAVELLQTPGTVLNCSTQEVALSKEIETAVFVLLTATLEDGTEEKKLLRMATFAQLYRKQYFAHPKDPVPPPNETDDA